VLAKGIVRQLDNSNVGGVRGERVFRIEGLVVMHACASVVEEH